jgi:hypothetical protein
MNSMRLTLAGLAATTLSLGALAPAAVAGGDHHGGHDDDPEVVIGLTDTTVDRLTRGANAIRALGAADKDTDDGDVYLSFPVRGGDHQRHGEDRSDVVGLAGALAVVGEGADATWSALRVDLEKGTISAVVNGGARADVLASDHDRRDHDGHYRGGYDPELELTAAGARSLNRAAVGDPFEAGDTFAGDSDGCS